MDTNGRPRNVGKSAGKSTGYGCPPEHTRFKPGKSGNPKGMKPGALSLKTAIKKALAERDPACPELTMADKVATAVVWQACKGNVQAARLVFEYVDGKPDNKPQQVEIRTAEEPRDVAALVERYTEAYAAVAGAVASSAPA